MSLDLIQLERNYSDHGIRMNCICPTRVDTKFIDQVAPERVHHASEHVADEAQAAGSLRYDVTIQ